MTKKATRQSTGKAKQPTAKPAVSKKKAATNKAAKPGTETAAQKARAKRTAAHMRDAVASQFPPPEKATRQQKPPEVAGLPNRSEREETEVQAAANEATQLNRQITTRIAGHESSRDRRAQARRDR